MVLQTIVNGLAIGGIYAIFALGYTLVFSILGIINFAHSAVFTLGAYFTYALLGSRFKGNGLLSGTELPFELPFWLAVLASAVLAGFVSVLIERIAFRPLRARHADPLLTLVSSLGVAIALVYSIQYFAAAEIYSYPSKVLGDIPTVVNFGTKEQPIVVRTVQLVIFGISMVMVVGLTLFMNATKTGKALRAVAEDTTTASLLGINTDRLILYTFFISGFLGGLAGTMVALNSSISGPTFGIPFGLRGLAVIVLGGMGSVPGAVLGGLVIGMGEAFLPSDMIEYKDTVAFGLLFIVLLLRPQGLLGQTQIQKV